MRRTERIVLALGTLGETRQPAFLSQCPDAISPAGQYLVRIGLVADIPDQPVVWRIEDVMQRNGQFDHAEAGAEMPTRLRYRVNELCAKLARKLRQIAFGQLAQICRNTDLVEQRRMRFLTHGNDLLVPSRQ